MASPIADYLQDLKKFHINSDSDNHGYVKIGATVLAVFLLGFAYMTHDAAHSGFPLIGASRHSLTYIKAKYKFIKQGKDMILEGLQKVYISSIALKHASPTTEFQCTDIPGHSLMESHFK